MGIHLVAKNLKWEAKKRLEEIEHCLYWKGKLHKADLIKRFGISKAQASKDLARYLELAPENMEYDRSLRAYIPNSDLNLHFIKPGIEDYFTWSGKADTVITCVPIPLRKVSPAILRPLINAIHQNQSIEIAYQSMSSEKPGRRRITPHSLVFDGYRYHVRGYCEKAQDYRDFVLGRVARAGDPGVPGQSKDKDDEWNTLTLLKVGAHPDLTNTQRCVIEKDFGMEDGVLKIRVRQAMLHYLCVQLRFDKLTQYRTAQEQQIVLLNPEALEG